MPDRFANLAVPTTSALAHEARATSRLTRTASAGITVIGIGGDAGMRMAERGSLSRPRTPGGGRVNRDQQARARALPRQGLSIRAIATELKVPHMTLANNYRQRIDANGRLSARPTAST